MAERIKVTAPGKLMLFGEHAVMYGYPCIVTAVDQRMSLVAGLTSDGNLSLNAPDVGVTNYRKDINNLGSGEVPKGARFIEFAVRRFRDKVGLSSGVSIETQSEFEMSGLGSSSASVVSTLYALSNLIGRSLSKQELFDLSFNAVLDVQKTGSGFDAASVIWGGTLLFVTGGKTIQPILANNLSIVVGHCGIKGETPVMVGRVKEVHEKSPKLFDEIFQLIGEIVSEAKVKLESGTAERVGELANLNQGLLEALGVSTIELSRLIYAARNAGAYGAKLSGAGGGDCITAFVDPNHEKVISKAIESQGGKIISVKPNAEGVRLEKL